MTDSSTPTHEAVYRQTAPGWDDCTALLAGPPVVTALPGVWPPDPLPAHAALQAALPWARCTPPYRQVVLPWAIPPWPGVHLGDLLTVALPDGPFAGIVISLARDHEPVYYVELMETGAEVALRAGWDADAPTP